MCSRSSASSGAGASPVVAGRNRLLAAGTVAESRGRLFGAERADQLALRHERAVGQHARTLDDVLQLANIAVPPRVEQQAFGGGRQALDSACCIRADASRMNAAVRYGMSSRRSRSGGSVTSTTLSR